MCAGGRFDARGDVEAARDPVRGDGRNSGLKYINHV